MIDRIIALLKPYNVDYEIYYEVVDEEAIEFRVDHLKQIKRNFNQGIALRVIKDGNIGFSAVTTENNIKELIDNAILSTQFGNKANFWFEKEDKETDVPIFDDGIINLTTDQIIYNTKEIIDYIHSYNNAIHSDIHIRKIVGDVKIVNSSGMIKEYKKSVLQFIISALLTKEKGLLTVFDGEALCNSKIEYKSIADRVIDRFKLAENEVNIRSGFLPCIFSPKAIYLGLLSPLKVGINGKFVQKGASPLCGRINNKIFSDKLTIYDDATLPYYLNSYPFDDEGSASKRTIIFEKGILTNFILDKQTAAFLKMSPTSNGKRPSPFGQPEPTTSNLVIKEGNIKLDSLIRNIKEGVLVDQLIGWAANPISGEFSGNIELGYKIDNGEIIGRIKDTVLSGNIYKDLLDIELTDEQQLVFGQLLTPHIYFDGLSVSASGSVSL